MRQAREQQDEELGSGQEDQLLTDRLSATVRRVRIADSAAEGRSQRKTSRRPAEDRDEDFGAEDDDVDEEEDELASEATKEHNFLAADSALTELQVAAEDDAALQAFMPAAPPQRLTLADIILAKIREKETEYASNVSGRWYAADITGRPSWLVFDKSRRSNSICCPIM